MWYEVKDYAKARDVICERPLGHDVKTIYQTFEDCSKKHQFANPHIDR